MLGAIREGGRSRFRVWAPRVRELELVVLPDEMRVPLSAAGGGYYEVELGLPAQARYVYLVDGERRRPDPASRSQPEGVHGPSELVEPSRFAWRHRPRPRRLSEYVIYELHVGTFSPRGSFDGVVNALPALSDLGVTAIELMPVGAFPGTRNWGYDGVHWFAPQASYGGPDGLRRLVDACHGEGLAVVMDVVYNHLGPEGNYLAEYGPYFTHRHQTPWGDALDYRRREVRDHILENARMWVTEYQVDALRLDAVHAIVDDSPTHIVAELTESVHALGPVQVIAESDLGDVKVIERREQGGWGCDAQWSDDFHHALHAAVTGERQRYYVDFGRISDLARSVKSGFVFTGQESAFRGGPFGTPAAHLPGERFVICAQNHDQIGNRAAGERLSVLVPGAAHAVAAILLTTPAVPLLFMGEEYGEVAPFLYFTDHGDPDLRRAVTEGRRREFGFERVPDPQAESTFLRSRIDFARVVEAPNAGLRRFYQALLALRRQRSSLRVLDRARTRTFADEKQRTLVIERVGPTGDETLLAASLSPQPTEVRLPGSEAARWQLLLDAGEARFGGPLGARLLRRAKAAVVTLPGYGVVLCER